MAEVPEKKSFDKKDTDVVISDFDNTFQFGDKDELIERLDVIANKELHSGFTEAEIIEFGNRSDFDEMIRLMVAEHNLRYPDNQITEAMFLKINGIVEGKLDYKFTLDSHAEEAFAKVHESGQKTGIVTTRGTKSVQRLIDYHEVRDLFDVIIGRQDVKERKPHPESLIKAMSMLGLNDFARGVYLGDSQKEDVGAGNAAHMRTVLVGNAPFDPNGQIPTHRWADLEPLKQIYGK